MDIEQLLQKFYAGDSNPEEERLLMQYFLTEENVDQRWKADRQLFLSLHKMQGQVPQGVSERLAASIKRMTAASEEDHVPSKSVTIKQVVTLQHQSPMRRRTMYYWISSAAAVAILCVSLFFVFRTPKTQVIADTFSDPEEAARFARQTLTFMSTQLNQGLNKVSEVEQEFERVDQILNKHIGK
ncbi:MAG: hypothetical protein LBE56_06350 [Tannerella sp.]|nr:hypothetical protein [Tannerella sp.]